jgi:Anti-sigma-K factor rskA, C-terminal
VDHAEVRDRLQDALLGPGKLTALEAGASAEGAQLAAHLEACPACRRELDALWETSAALAAAAPDDLHAPPEARERVLRAIHGTGALRGPGRPQLLRPSSVRGLQAWPARLAAIAAVVLFAAGGLLAMRLASELDEAAKTTAELSRIVVATEDLLRDPSAVRVALARPDGYEAGSLLASRDQDRIVVLAQDLPEPPSGGSYFCYLERDGRRIPVGYMHLAGDLAYWAGPMAEPADAGSPGDRFLVVREWDGMPALVGSFDEV